MTNAGAFEHVVLQNTLVALWTGNPSVEPLRTFGHELEALALRRPDGIYVLNVSTEHVVMPDARARELLRQQFTSMRGRVHGLAMVLEKGGVLASLSRTVLSTLLTLSGRPFPMTIHGSRVPAAQWLAAHPGVPPAHRLLELLGSLSRHQAA